MVIPLQWAMNRDVSLWGSDANQFRPERFRHDGKVVEAKHFLPFQVSSGAFCSLLKYC